MVGAEKRSLLLLLGSPALTDPGGFTDFTVESAGFSALVCSFLSSALRSIRSPLPFLLNAQSALRNKNRHTLHSVFKLEQSLRTQRETELL